MSNILASDLRDMAVLSDRGLRIGRIFDFDYSRETGELENLVLEPEYKEIARNLSTDGRGKVIVPTGAVVAVKEYIVVDEKCLALKELQEGG